MRAAMQLIAPKFNLGDEEKALMMFTRGGLLNKTALVFNDLRILVMIRCCAASLTKDRRHPGARLRLFMALGVMLLNVTSVGSYGCARLADVANERGNALFGRPNSLITVRTYPDSPNPLGDLANRLVWFEYRFRERGYFGVEAPRFEQPY